MGSYNMNDYMYAVDRSDDYLAHYGVKGMRWGVRKAIESGNSRRLGRAYNRAARKLARLEKRAANGKKYARRAAALGAGAAAAGGLAVAGTGGVGSALRRTGRIGGKAAKGVGSAMQGAGRIAENAGLLFRKSHNRRLRNIGAGISTAGTNIQRAGGAVHNVGSRKISIGMNTAGHAVEDWGRSSSVAQKGARKLWNRAAKGNMPGVLRNPSINASQKLYKMNNNTVARIGAGAVGAGLAAGAGYNAYRAATTKRAAKKAAQWRSEMNKAFAGTQYANGGNSRRRKRRR